MEVNDNESVSGFFCMLVLSACMPFSVWWHVVVLVRYRSQRSGAIPLILVGDVVGMVMLGGFSHRILIDLSTSSMSPNFLFTFRNYMVLNSMASWGMMLFKACQFMSGKQKIILFFPVYRRSCIICMIIHLKEFVW